MNPTEMGEGTTRASLELLYHISRELAAALDLRTVLQRVLLLSMETVGATSGSIIVLDEDGKPVESAIITSQQVMNHTTERLRITLERGLAGWVARNRQAVLIEDTSRDERWLARKYADEEDGGAKSAVSAPLLVRDRLVGVMTLAEQDPGFFSNEHLALVQAIADQAGIAVLNARLYEESQRQARVMTGLAESAAAITASLKLEDVLGRILEQTSQALRVRAVSLALIEPAENKLVFQAAAGWQRKEVEGICLPLGKGIAGWVAREGQGTVVQDVRADPRFDAEVDQRTGIQSQAIACAPIRYRGQVIGVLEAVNPVEGDFDTDDLLVLTGIGSLAGTAIRHAQLFERLQAAHQRYRELFEDSIEPILITDFSGKIQEANRQAVLTTDYEKKDLLVTSIRQIHQVDEKLVGAGYKQIANGDTISYESTLKTRTGKSIPVQVYVRQVIIEGTSYLQWILRDITEKKNLDTLRDDLLSMIYHDLQSPLANVVSSLDVVQTLLPPSDDPTLQSLINIGVRSTQRIQRLTSSLLDINRLEAGQEVGDRRPFKVDDMVRDALEVVIPVAQNRRQVLENLIPANLPPVWVDGDMIRRVLTNLLENAVKFTPQDGTIQVGGRHEGDQVYLWVQDNGPGIPAEQQERIFDKYTRLSLREAPRGLGLGLAYCRLAIEGHGGRIWVESVSGSGARFIFTLPVTPQST